MSATIRTCAGDAAVRTAGVKIRALYQRLRIGCSAIVLRGDAAKIRPDLVADIERGFGERTVVDRAEVFFQLFDARCAENETIGGGVVQNPVKREADNGPALGFCERGKLFHRAMIR